MTFPHPILIVEDDDDDFFFLHRHLQRAGAERILRVESGREALDYLQGTGRFADRMSAPLPELMFLDLKLGSNSGHAVLAWMKANLVVLPRIFILTGSDERRDHEAITLSGMAEGYFVKPAKQAELAAVLARHGGRIR